MKKTMKKLIALAVVFVMLLTAVPAFASGQSCIYGEDTVSAVFYPNQKMHNQYFGSVGSTKKIQVKSSNSRVGVCVTEKYEYGYSLYFRAKRSGTTTLTIKVGNETKKVTHSVSSYRVGFLYLIFIICIWYIFHYIRHFTIYYRTKCINRLRGDGLATT